MGVRRISVKRTRTAIMPKREREKERKREREKRKKREREKERIEKRKKKKERKRKKEGRLEGTKREAASSPPLWVAPVPYTLTYLRTKSACCIGSCPFEYEPSAPL